MAITDVQVLNASAIPRYLNADLVVTTTAGSEAVTNTCGTYALINQIISDLSSIKASIKTEEKKISAAINLELIDGGGAFTSTTGSGLTMSTLTTGTTTGFSASAVTIRGQESANIGDNLAVLVTADADYTESAVASILADIWKLVAKLKAGKLATGASLDTAVTTVLQTAN